jgi:hypothetical protein
VGNRAGDAAGTVRDRPSATVGGGAFNTASGVSSTVAGGEVNTASGSASTVGGGSLNTAAGDYSVAMGRRAKATFDGDFVFADSNNFDFSPNGPDNFRVRATGGVRFVVDIDGTGATTWSCGLVSGGSWVCSSDRNQKQDLELLDGTAVLDKLVAMPVYAWSPKGKNSHTRHFGPMAQDFYATFGLGDSDVGIGQQDADGVAPAAIQGLHAKVESRQSEIDGLRAQAATQQREIAELRSHSTAEIAKLKLAVEVLLARTSPEAQVAVAR